MAKSEMTTADQKFYRVEGQWKAEIDVDITHEWPDAPSIAECRHAVLPLGNNRYAIYDRLLSRIVNGVYKGDLASVLGCVQDYNDRPSAPQDMSPNGKALGLKYPVCSKKGVA